MVRFVLWVIPSNDVRSSFSVGIKKNPHHSHFVVKASYCYYYFIMGLFFSIFPQSSEIFFDLMKLSDCYWITSASFSKKKILHKVVGTEKLSSAEFFLLFCFLQYWWNNWQHWRKRGLQCWKSLALKQTSAFIKMSQGRENKLRSGRKMFLK